MHWMEQKTWESSVYWSWDRAEIIKEEKLRRWCLRKIRTAIYVGFLLNILLEFFLTTILEIPRNLFYLSFFLLKFQAEWWYSFLCFLFLYFTTLCCVLYACCTCTSFLLLYSWKYFKGKVFVLDRCFRLRGYCLSVKQSL